MTGSVALLCVALRMPIVRDGFVSKATTSVGVSAVWAAAFHYKRSTQFLAHWTTRQWLLVAL